jgi:hypothetical protein
MRHILLLATLKVVFKYTVFYIQATTLLPPQAWGIRVHSKKRPIKFRCGQLWRRRTKRHGRRKYRVFRPPSPGTFDSDPPPPPPPPSLLSSSYWDIAFYRIGAVYTFVCVFSSSFNKDKLGQQVLMINSTITKAGVSVAVRLLWLCWKGFSLYIAGNLLRI